MTLTDKELNILRNFTDKYSDIHTRIGELESQLFNLKNEKTDLLNELTETREEERGFNDKLINKYGRDISVNLESGQIIKE